MTQHGALLPRLGVYVGPGRLSHPSLAVRQAQMCESFGFGSAWLSERWGSRDFTAVAGAIAVATSRIHIGIGVTHFQTRHPAVFGSGCTTLQELSNGRVTIGIGRSLPSLWTRAGLEMLSDEALSDYVMVVRRLCTGEGVDYSGQIGRFTGLRLQGVDGVAEVPFVLAAIGPRALELAGRQFDGVLLHPFLTPDAVRTSSARVRAAATAAGRDPSSVRIRAAVALAVDGPGADQATDVAARAGAYLRMPTVGEALCRANGWPLDALAPLRARAPGGAPAERSGASGAADPALPPVEWVGAASVMGDVSARISQLDAYLAAGADELIIHTPDPGSLGPLAEALR